MVGIPSSPSSFFVDVTVYASLVQIFHVVEVAIPNVVFFVLHTWENYRACKLIARSHLGIHSPKVERPNTSASKSLPNVLWG
jgi:hypothetical protein